MRGFWVRRAVAARRVGSVALAVAIVLVIGALVLPSVLVAEAKRRVRRLRSGKPDKRR